MNETMKSTAMVINETKQRIAQVCNESKLPPCVLELIVKDVYNEINFLASRQLQEENMEYMKKLSQEKVKSEEVKEEN